MNKIFSERTGAVLSNKHNFLVGYALAGYPNSEAFFDVLSVLESSPLDILEVGFPSANPYNDGLVIAEAHKSVNRAICCSIEYWQRIRERAGKPIWVMSYADDFIKNGKYADFCRLGVIDGMVVPDLTEEERCSLFSEAKEYGVDVIGLSNPDMDDAELDNVYASFSLVYEQLYVGQTGKDSGSEMYHHMLDKSLTYPDVIGLAGFGITTREQAERKFTEGFRGVVIGTAIVKRLNESISALKEYLEDLGRARSKCLR